MGATNKGQYCNGIFKRGFIMYTQLIKDLQVEMDQRVESVGGLDVVADHYDYVYRESFKGSDITLKNYALSLGHADIENVKQEIFDDTITALCESENEELIRKNKPSYEDGEHAQDSFYYFLDSLRDQWENENSDKMDQLYTSINDDTVLCFLCNYKGEGESIALKDLCVNLRTWKGKHNSFNF
jgi:hypothetical protein